MDQSVTRSIARGKLARALLTTTCLTAASSAVATAGIVTEGPDTGGPFPTTALGYLLPVGTNIVNGQALQAAEGSEIDGWFEFQGLAPNTLFKASAQFTGTCPSGGEGSTCVFDVNLFDTTGDYLSSGQRISQSGSFELSATIPLNGDLVTRVNVYDSNFPASAEYSIQVTQGLASGSPEPADLPLTAAGLALTGALAWRRKRRQ
jgi:hypothetical protein